MHGVDDDVANALMPCVSGGVRTVDVEDPGYALDCELVEVLLLLGMFAGLSCVVVLRGSVSRHSQPTLVSRSKMCRVLSFVLR